MDEAGAVGLAVTDEPHGQPAMMALPEKMVAPQQI
jgi:hypothetical protein